MRSLKAKNADERNDEIQSSDNVPGVEIIFGASSKDTDADAEETDTEGMAQNNRSAAEDTDAEEADTEAIAQDDITAKSVVFSAVENGTIEDSTSAHTDAKGMDSAVVAQKNRTAILLLDFQNEFVKKGGKLHDDIAATMEKTGVIQNVSRLVDLARKNEALIIHSPVVMKETGAFNSAKRRVSITDIDINEEQKVKYSEQYGLFTENTWNCEISHEVEPGNDDFILADRSDFSAFAGTKLQTYLERNHINHFFIMGFLTNVCVYQTSKDAAKFMPHMSTYVVSDCCAAQSMNAHNAALENISKKSVTVVSSSAAGSVLEQCAASNKSRVLDGSDQWLLIDKIFAFADVDGNNKLSFDELQSLIGSMPSSSSILSILSESLGGNGDQCLTRESMYKILFERKPRSGCFEKLPIFILMWLLPIFYSMTTRLPFIFLALEIRDVRGGTFWEIGLVLGAYQTSRALGNLLIVLFGGRDPFKRLEILQILFGLFGWLFLAFYQRDGEESFFSIGSSNPIDDGSDPVSPIWPLYALFFVGLCETVVNLQRSLMIETAKESPSGLIDEDVMASRLSIQYAMVACGSVIAFVGGGYAYTYYGYTAVCELGVLCQIVQLTGATIYIALAKKKIKNIQGDELDGNDFIRCIIYQFQTSSVIAKYANDVASGTENAINSEIAGLSAAARQAKSDRILTHSLHEMFHCYFTKERDDIASMEELLKSIDSTGTGLASKRPLAMAIGKNKLSKLILFLMKSKGEGSLTEREFISYWAPRVYLSMFESSQEASVNVVWPYMRAVILTQAIAALCIGIFLSTALLSYTERFDIDAAQVGLLLGIGEGLGMITILSKSFVSRPANDKKNSNNSFRCDIMKAMFARPLNVPFILLLGSTASMLFSINNFVVAVACQMVFSSVNDLGVSLMNELVGTSLPPDKFRFYQGIGQWMRRLGNMVTAILGPIFFGINEAFPFVFFGSFVFVWALILWFLMYLHADRIQQSISKSGDDVKGEYKELSKSCLTQSVLGTPFVPFVETARTPWHVLEQRYYCLNKEIIEEELQSWKSAQVDISLLETRIRCIAAALEVEKDQRRALEDRMYARGSTQSAKYMI